MRTRGSAAEGLIGRDRELAVLEDFVGSATRSGGALLVTGEAGAGKSALLERAASVVELQPDSRVLRVSGVEFEADLSYAGLNQLLLPALDDLQDLPDREVGALRAALGLQSAPASELLQLATAMVGFLRHLRRGGPLLLVADDVHWLDHTTARLLSLMCRRLDGSGVGVLFAQRAGHNTLFDLANMPSLVLPPLLDPDADALLRAHHPQLHPSVRQRVLADAGGIPLALIELPRGLTAEQESAVEMLPPTLPLSERLRRHLARRVAALPAPSRLLLLLAALHYGDGAELMQIVAGSSADLAPAETAGLITVDHATRELKFAHPLVRAAVVDLASPPERRSTHRRLSQLASRPHVRALHLADSVLGTDDDVAALLDDVADATVARGDPGRAVAILLRAADLTSAPAERARRLAAAAYLGANVTGSLSSATTLLARARSADPDGGSTLQLATAAAAHLLNSDRGVDIPHRMLTSALAAVPDDTADPRVVQEAIHTLMLVCAFGGRADLWTGFQEAVARTGQWLSPELRLAASTFADPARATPQQLAELDQLVAAVEDSSDPVRVLEVATAGHYVDREPAAALARVARAGRSGGPVPLAAQALVMTAMTAFHQGRWDDATALADEGISLCREHGYQLLEWGMLNPKMLVAAARGDSAYLTEVRERLQQWPIPRQMFAARGFTANVDGLDALSQGRFADAYSAYTSTGEPGTLPPYVQVVVWNLLDLVEAAVRSGHVAEGRRHTELAAATLAAISPRLHFQAEAAAALVAPDGEYPALFDRVLADPQSSRWPFQLARLELAYGERLRLNRAMRLARLHLERAGALFGDLRAMPWVARTETALRATGRTRLSTDGVGSRRLTPQELQVAELAASGLSNREIAERLFLSPRTVGAHLYRAFPKLGVTTRAGLRDALAQLPG